jgi:hypothetical protein
VPLFFERMRIFQPQLQGYDADGSHVFRWLRW